jgi:hypothetical protein
VSKRTLRNASALERSARRLLETETLEEKDLLELVGPKPGPPASMAAE